MNSTADNDKHDQHDQRDLAGRRAVVTGGTRGIGEAVVRRLLEAGADVLATARTEPATVPDGAGFVAADVTTREGAEAIAAAAQERFGGADIVVHNAGGGTPSESTVATPAAEWQSALDLNFISAVRLDALLAPAMREAGSGAIVHVSSAAVLTPVGMFLPYTAAKAALENYSRGLAIDLAPSGVRVNVVSPGRTATPGGEATRREWAAIAAGSDTPPAETNADDVPPLGREGRPDDIADAVHFLVSGRAAWLTGRNLIVDGGEFPMG
ncbi:NAD(P)-dependent dehydrogenase (short-subunit alcohol dehydrogenase family) [Nocardioides albertanoniae]|uniref:NAD(P)-dependent dehydrogenase (Short-subunit alcohol dehydrogenase family) n=1 Tax=Nocardioides albertanoniae TaxID=1175486 RepID=A0A543A0Z3_9ACTN|nr:oxidoreductase [Nocardioides albertanoniae]TQL66251.1 NAD(P)-dependent dehydrogenase (short-subunit alcohol dehydrogenase family) [Nocardioides albertanoniae]